MTWPKCQSEFASQGAFARRAHAPGVNARLIGDDDGLAAADASQNPPLETSRRGCETAELLCQWQASAVGGTEW